MVGNKNGETPQNKEAGKETTLKQKQWLELGFCLVVLVALLVLTRMLLPMIADYNNNLTESHVQSGYVAAMQALFLLLWLFAGFVLSVLLSRGVPVAPLMWIVNILHISYAYGESWHAVGDSLMFFSTQVNVLLMLLVPPLVGAAWWWAAGQLGHWQALSRMARKLQLAALWCSLMLMVVAANWFFWHWSPDFFSGNWPNPLIWVGLVPGVLLLLGSALANPWRAMAVFWAGLMLPLLVQVVIHGLYDGMLLGLLLLLPVTGQEFSGLWMALLILLAGLPLLAVAVNQAWLWWNDESLLELY